jgi:transcriptional regulator with XRE-family HTH domain
MDVRLLVGQNVRRLRLAADLSQEAVAERMGVDRAYVSALELGKRNPTIITLWQIAEALEVGLVDLVVEGAQVATEEPRTRARRKRG